MTLVEGPQIEKLYRPNELNRMIFDYKLTTVINTPRQTCMVKPINNFILKEFPTQLTVKFVESVWVDIKDIGVDPMNPNTMTKAQHESLGKSMDENGFIEDVLLNNKKTSTGQKYTLINGHQRIYVLQDKGEKRVLAKIIKVTALKARQIGWAMNRNVGQDDKEKLSNLLLYAYKNDKLDAFLESVPTFGEDQAKLLIDKFHDTGLFQEGDEIIPETPTSTKTKIGDVYQLGIHKIMCGDASSQEHVDKLFAGKKANHVNMDPPYGVDYLGKGHLLNKINKSNPRYTVINNDVDIEDYTAFFKSVLDTIPLTEYNTINVWMSGLRLHELRIAFEDAGYTWGDYLVWVKSSIVPGRKDHNPRHEFCLYGWKGKHKFYGGNDASSCYFENKPVTSKEHPTMKPVNLIARTILEGSKPKDIVYDGFCGSGTTLISCENENRICFGMELSEYYVDIIISRWETKTNKKARKLS